MNRILFSLGCIPVALEGDFFMTDETEFSALYDVVEDRDGRRAVVDIKSIAKCVWRNNQATWVPDRVPSYVIRGIEDALDRQLAYEQVQDEEAAMEAVPVAEGWQ